MQNVENVNSLAASLPIPSVDKIKSGSFSRSPFDGCFNVLKNQLPGFPFLCLNLCRTAGNLRHNGFLFYNPDDSGSAHSFCCNASIPPSAKKTSPR